MKIESKIIDKVLTDLGWTEDECLNKNRQSGTIPITAKELVTALLNEGTVKSCATSLGRSYNSINSIIQRELLPIFGPLNGGNETWKFKLLNLIEYKICSSCRGILPFILFDNNICSTGGKFSSCKTCRKEINAVLYRKESVQLSHKRSQEKHYHNILARNAQYRVERAKRSVLWADQEKIKDFYQNCPKGMHVDHILPLKGELVSGLHVLGNLQYLTPHDNLSKGNSFDIDMFNNIGSITTLQHISYLDAKTTKVVPKDKPKPKSITYTKECPVCNEIFSSVRVEQICCSTSCASSYRQIGKKTEDILGCTKESVEAAIWFKPYSSACKEFNLSDKGLIKMAKRLGCIMPPPYYHSKSQKDKELIRNNTFNIKE